MTPRQRLADTRLYLVCERGRARSSTPRSRRRDLVQLRDKSLDDAGWSSREVFRAAADEHGALFILNDRPDLVEACAADGVHIGQDDDARRGARGGRP